MQCKIYFQVGGKQVIFSKKGLPFRKSNDSSVKLQRFNQNKKNLNFKEVNPSQIMERKIRNMDKNQI